jgi:hypothetical protein
VPGCPIFGPGVSLDGLGLTGMELSDFMIISTGETNPWIRHSLKGHHPLIAITTLGDSFKFAIFKCEIANKPMESEIVCPFLNGNMFLGIEGFSILSTIQVGQTVSVISAWSSNFPTLYL